MTSDVEFHGVSKVFGDFLAVDNISFSIPQGSFFSLLGPSGCGKTTTLRMTSGFEWPDRGDVLIAGQSMQNVPAYARPTNMVFQRWALFPHMTVAQNVAFGLEIDRRPRAEINKRVGEALELVGLTDFAARKPRQLSGGQMQRVALARALVKQPKVLLLDEPLGALDLKLRMQMQLELKRIQREVGTTFMYVTHDQGEALTMSDQIAVMNKGRIDQLDSPQAIYDRPATRFVASFIGNANLIPVEILESSAKEASVAIGGLKFTVPTTEKLSGKKGIVSLRFERIRVGPEAKKQNVSGKATIRDVIFSGSSITYVVTLEGSDTDLTVEAPHDGTSAPHSLGETVHIGWDGGAATVFADENGNG
ncbi:ABC transporter ATP-binding protein [Mesorhizobium sp. Z1-4]|uniref:ABC transporter ATP-binding protein n=1 Tax=Mesorhizobium sp. Z1-4 TaxID=2448478 RepID=UPI000FDAEFF2|nr:ABC transporter ATP-binding protein [Mesorhizobium sp. Z1-4]